MAYMLVKIEIPTASAKQLNTKLVDNSNPNMGASGIRDVLSSLMAGAADGQVDVAVRETDLAITPDGDGEARSYNLR